jgi:hypothetical protein
MFVYVKVSNIVEFHSWSNHTGSLIVNMFVYTSAKRTSSSAHQKVTCSGRDIPENCSPGVK